MTPKPFKEISSLLDQLAIANENQGSRSNESRKIRIELRKLGHRGGLRNRLIK